MFHKIGWLTIAIFANLPYLDHQQGDNTIILYEYREPLLPLISKRLLTLKIDVFFVCTHILAAILSNACIGQRTFSWAVICINSSQQTLYNSCL